MEDTKSLLMMVLHKIFQNQPKTIENTFQLIHSFNNGKIDKTSYEKTLKTICDLMDDELPSPILVYILTLVDMPQDLDAEESPLLQKMRRTHTVLPDSNVRPHLLEFLNKLKPATAHHKAAPQKNPSEAGKIENCPPKRNRYRLLKCPPPPQFQAPNACVKSTLIQATKRGPRRRLLLPKPLVENPKKLVDICACFVVRKEAALKEMYKHKQVKAWNLINRNIFTGDKLKQCYRVLKDLNKKSKWLRGIESNNVSAEMLMDEYKNSDVFFREKHVYDKIKRNPFSLSQECEKAIDMLF